MDLKQQQQQQQQTEAVTATTTTTTSNTNKSSKQNENIEKNVSREQWRKRELLGMVTQRGGDPNRIDSGQNN